MSGIDAAQEYTNKILSKLADTMSPEVAAAIQRPDLIAFMTDRIIETTDREGNEMLVLKPLPTLKQIKK